MLMKSVKAHVTKFINFWQKFTTAKGQHQRMFLIIILLTNSRLCGNGDRVWFSLRHRAVYENISGHSTVLVEEQMVLTRRPENVSFFVLLSFVPIHFPFMIENLCPSMFSGKFLTRRCFWPWKEFKENFESELQPMGAPLSKEIFFLNGR